MTEHLQNTPETRSDTANMESYRQFKEKLNSGLEVNSLQSLKRIDNLLWIKLLWRFTHNFISLGWLFRSTIWKSCSFQLVEFLIESCETVKELLPSVRGDREKATGVTGSRLFSWLMSGISVYMCVGRGLPSTLSQGGQSTAVLLGHLLQLQREGLGLTPQWPT